MDDDVCLDEESDSSLSCAYSDRINSDVEAELYSIIHHQETLTEISKCPEDVCENFNVSNVERNLLVNKSDENSNYLLRFQTDCLFENLSFLQKTSNARSDAKQKISALNLSSDCSESEGVQAVGAVRKPIKARNSSLFNISTSSKCDTVELSDSDESVILIDDDGLNNSFEVNVSNEVDVDFVSNSSDSSDRALPCYLQRKMSLKLTSPGIKRKGSSSKDDWYIDEEDRQPFKRRARINRELNCTNCYKKGHIARFCSAEKFFRCFICGGHHPASQCENRICSRCYNMGHESRFCYMQLYQNCDLCNMHGHKTKDCPDHWRRFHLTTEESNFIPGKPLNQDGNFYCFNCGYPGHIGSVCRELRTPKGSLVTWPCVVSYRAPNDGSMCQAKVFKGENGNIKYQFPKRVQDFIDERKKGKLKKWEFYKQRSIERKQKKLALREKDFPRTTKQQDKVFTEFPESVKMDLAKAKKRKMRKMKQMKRKKERQKNTGQLQGEYGLFRQKPIKNEACAEYY